MKLKKDSYSVNEKSKKNDLNEGYVNKAFSDENNANVDKKDIKKYSVK